MRRFLTASMIATGIALMVVAYLGFAAPWGADGITNSDPRVPFAPVLFIVGVMLTFGSALVYEMFPERRNDRDGAPGEPLSRGPSDSEA